LRGSVGDGRCSLYTVVELSERSLDAAVTELRRRGSAQRGARADRTDRNPIALPILESAGWPRCGWDAALRRPHV